MWSWFVADWIESLHQFVTARASRNGRGVGALGSPSLPATNSAAASRPPFSTGALPMIGRKSPEFRPSSS